VAAHNIRPQMVTLFSLARLWCRCLWKTNGRNYFRHLATGVA